MDSESIWPAKTCGPDCSMCKAWKVKFHFPERDDGGPLRSQAVSYGSFVRGLLPMRKGRGHYPKLYREMRDRAILGFLRG